MEALIFTMVINKFFSWLYSDTGEVEVDRNTQQYKNWKYGIGE
jgi:hypothetical protein